MRECSLDVDAATWEAPARFRAMKTHDLPEPPPLAALDGLAEIATEVLARCRAGGAAQAEVGVSASQGLAVTVRNDEVETLEFTRDRGLSLTVYCAGRKGSASTADLAPDSIRHTVEQALAIVRHTEPDPCAGLADPERMARTFPDLDLWHPQALDAEAAIALARRCEGAGLAVSGISNTEGASVSAQRAWGVYANSHGFIGRDWSTSHSLSCALIAGDDDGMQRDYWYDASLDGAALAHPESIGAEAARRTLARLDARSIATTQCPVLFVPELARSLVGHLVGAVSGGALYRKASFLLDHAGKQIFPAWVHLHEQPLLARAFGSGSYDQEGVATSASDLVREGVLQRYVLGSYSARKLGLVSTANAGGVHNLTLEPNTPQGLTGLIAGLKRGLVVTELMGQGVNNVTGDYSRGAAGFWVENGQIVHAVEEVTIAGNLREIYLAIEAVGSDQDTRGNIRAGSVLVGRMTVAGH